MQNADLEKLVDAAEEANPSLKTDDFIGRAEKLKEELDNGYSALMPSLTQR